MSLDSEEWLHGASNPYLSNKTITQNFCDGFRGISRVSSLSLGNDSANVSIIYEIEYLNITCELPIKFAQVLYGYIIPVLLLVTIITNTLVIMVLSRPTMYTPTNIILMGMAFAEMFTLLIPSPWYMYSYTFGNHFKPLYPPLACHAWDVMHEILPNLFHTASIWLTVLLAAQRYIHVCHPPMAKQWCTVPIVARAIKIVFFVAFMHQFTRFFEFRYSEHIYIRNGVKESVCAREVAGWIVDVITENYYYSFYYWFRVLFVHTLPCISLVVLNILLLRAMKKARLNRQRLLNERLRGDTCRRQRDSNCTTWMLIVVVSIVLLVEIPLAVVTILHIMTMYAHPGMLDYGVASKLILLTNFLIIVSYPMNFAIYCGMSRQFREVFQELFLGGEPVTARPMNGSSRHSVCATRTSILTTTL